MEQRTSAEVYQEKEATNATMKRQTNTIHATAGCCGFIHAFQRLFRNKKRGRCSLFRRPSQTPETLSAGCQQQPPTVEAERGSLTGLAIQDPVVKESLEPEATKETVRQESVPVDSVPEKRVPEEDQISKQKDQVLAEKDQVRNEKDQVSEKAEQIPEEAMLEAPDTDESDLEYAVAYDSDFEELSFQKSPEPARRSNYSQKKAKNSTKNAAAPSSAVSELLLRPRVAIIIFHSNVVHPPAILVKGIDKHENDHLLTQVTERVVFFCLASLPSAHLYLQLESGQGLRDVPRVLLNEAAQLCKDNSSKRNKVANVVVVYTQGSNLCKARHMKAGEVGFVCDRDVHKILVAKRDNKAMDSLNMTKNKVLSRKWKRYKKQRALERKWQKAEQQEREREQQQDDTEDEATTPEDALELTWGIEAEQLPTTRPVRRQRRRHRKWSEEDTSDKEPKEETEQQEKETLPETQTTRCFPLVGVQRRLLHRNRALLECRFDVRVEAPRKGAAEGRGTVRGAPEDVVDALVELKKLLCPDRQRAAASVHDMGSQQKQQQVTHRRK